MEDSLNKKKFQTIYEFDRAIKDHSDETAEILFAQPIRGNIAERFSIYVTGYGARTRDSMEETYEHLSRLMGEELWLDLGGRYTQAYPSTSYNLADVGASLPEFLRETNANPEWIAMASLELMVWTSFHAARASVVTLNDFSRLADDSRLTFAPSTILFESDFNCLSAWNDSNVSSLIEKQERGVIYRKNFQVRVLEISTLEFTLLSDLRGGKTFGESLEPLMSKIEPNDISNWLKNWLEGEYFSQIRRDS